MTRQTFLICNRMNLSFAFWLLKYDLRFIHFHKIYTSARRCRLTLPLLNIFPPAFCQFCRFCCCRMETPGDAKVIFMMWLIEKQGKIISLSLLWRHNFLWLYLSSQWRKRRWSFFPSCCSFPTEVMWGKWQKIFI